MLVCDTVDKGIHAHPLEGKSRQPFVVHYHVNDCFICMFFETYEKNDVTSNNDKNYHTVPLPSRE